VYQIVDIVIPVFGLIGIGFAVAWLRLLPEGSDGRWPTSAS